MVGFAKGLGCGCCSPCPHGYPTEWSDDFSSNTLSQYVITGSESAGVSIIGGRLRLDCSGVCTSVSAPERASNVRKDFEWHVSSNPKFFCESKFYCTESFYLQSPGSTFSGPVVPYQQAGFFLYSGLKLVAGITCGVRKFEGPTYVYNYGGFYLYGPGSTTGSTTFASASFFGQLNDGDTLQIELENVGTDTAFTRTFLVNRVKIRRNGVIIHQTGTSGNSVLNWMVPSYACEMNTFFTMRHNSSVDPEGFNEFDDFEVWQQ